MDNDSYISDIPSAYWKSIEYEYATCSECGFNEYTDWDCTNEAKEKIKTFHETYRYCPGCGRKMGQPPKRGEEAEMTGFDIVCPGCKYQEMSYEPKAEDYGQDSVGYYCNKGEYGVERCPRAAQWRDYFKRKTGRN